MEKKIKYSMKLAINDILIFLAFCLIPVVSSGQDKPKIVDTSIFPSDTTRTKPWEVIYGDTLQADTVSEALRFDIVDSIQAYFLPGRFELSDWAAKTQEHDAGDYLRFNPSDFFGIWRYKNVDVDKVSREMRDEWDRGFDHF